MTGQTHLRYSYLHQQVFLNFYFDTLENSINLTVVRVRITVWLKKRVKGNETTNDFIEQKTLIKVKS